MLQDSLGRALDAVVQWSDGSLSVVEMQEIIFGDVPAFQIARELEARTLI